MKVEIKSKSNTISNSDIQSLISMIESTCKNISNPIKINREDDVKKLFNRSISRTIKERQHHYFD